MPSQLRLAFAREEEIAAAVTALTERTRGFQSPRLILIGGYALRTFVPFSRSTRDCDFAFRKGGGWLVDSIQRWLPGYQTAALEKRGDHGYLRCMKLINAGGVSAKVSLDFMEGKVVGRTSDEVILLDDAFERDARRVTISISDKPVDVFVPSYRDYFILKVVSGRRSDVRDIASLVWKLGVPDVKPRLRQILPHPEVFQRKIREVIVPDLEDARFVHSWRGTFVTEELSDADRLGVVKLLKDLP